MSLKVGIKRKAINIMRIRKTAALALAVLMLLSAVSLAACGSDKGTTKKYARGTVTGNVYHSDFAELTFTKPDDWTFATDEEIANMLGVGLDIMKDGDSLGSSDLASTIDFQAVSPIGSSVTLTIEKQPALATTLNDIDDYVGEFKKTMLEQLDGAYTYKFGETSDVVLGGNTYKRIDGSIMLSGLVIKQAIYLRIVGNYLVNITMTQSTGDTELSEMEAMIS